VLYASAYKAPSPLLLHATPYQVGDVVGNPKLKPQYVHSVEGNLSLKWERFSATTGVAYNLLSDKAEFVQQGVNRTAENLSQIGSLSWETELRANYKEWVNGYVMAELQHTRRDLGMIGYQANLYGWRNVIYPPYIFRFGLRGKTPKVPLSASINGVLAGPRRSSDMNSLEAFGVYTLKPYLLLGASVSVNEIEFIKDRETVFTFSAKNILGASGPDPGFAGIDYPLAASIFFLDIRQEI
jgi:outer membrane receptor for ferrienterochelin and colicins